MQALNWAHRHFKITVIKPRTRRAEWRLGGIQLPLSQEMGSKRASFCEGSMLMLRDVWWGGVGLAKWKAWAP